MDATNIQSDQHCKRIGSDCPLSEISAALWQRLNCVPSRGEKLTLLA